MLGKTSKQESEKNDAVYDNFKYKIYETPKTLRLVESFLGTEEVIGEVRFWKKTLIKEINKLFKNKSNREYGYRLFLAIKILNKIRHPEKAQLYLESMKNITLEETIFWVWQYHSYQDKAVTAFKAIHINQKEI